MRPALLRFSAALLTAAASLLPAQNFRNPVRIVTANQPTYVLTGDFDGDGHLDLAYTETQNGSSTLHILLARAGTYPEASTVAMPQASHCLIADVNRDGHPDVVCGTDQASSNPAQGIVTMLNNGDGTFAAPVTSAVPSQYADRYVLPLATADFNRDGSTDLIASSFDGNETGIFLGQGDGTFRFSATLANIAATRGQVLDLNGDGLPDLYLHLSDGHEDTVLLGRGDGTFQPPNYLYGVYTLADVDGDGHPDLIGFDSVFADQGVLLFVHGNADGTFQTANPIARYTVPPTGVVDPGAANVLSVLAYRDLNGDGIPDLLAASNDGLTVLSGRGSFQFQPTAHAPVGQQFASAGPNAPNGVAIDLDGDGNLDYVAAGYFGLYISYGRSNGTFASATAYESGSNVTNITVADFTGDGIPDVISIGDTQLYLAVGKGDGTFAKGVPIAGTSYFTSAQTRSQYASLVHGDFNGDGKQDLALAQILPQGTTFLFLAGNGNGTFDAAKTIPAKNTIFVGFSQSDVRDFNHDGRDDLAFVDAVAGRGTLYVNLGQSDGSFVQVATALQSLPYAFGDLFGWPSLSVVYADHGVLLAQLGNGDGTFGGPTTFGGVSLYSAGYAVDSLVCADFNGDGRKDVAVLLSASNGADPTLTQNRLQIVYIGPGAPASNNVTVLPTGGVGNLFAADLNGDGISDLAYTYASLYTATDALLFRTGKFDGDLSDEHTLVIDDVLSPTAVDVNGDGRLDLVVGVGNYNQPANAFDVLLNDGNIPTVTGTLIAAPEPSLVNSAFTLTASLQPPAGASSAPLTGSVTFSVDGTVVGTAALTNNQAQVTVPGTLPVGTHTLTATWPGQAGAAPYPALTLTGTHVVQGLPVTLTLAATSPVVLGGTSRVTVSITNAAPQAASPYPGGTITLTDNGTVFSTATSPGGFPFPSVAINDLLITPGTHTIVATYSGDAQHATATATTTVQVSPVPTVTVIASSVNPAAAGQPITFTVQVTASTASYVAGAFSGATVTLNGLPGGAITVPFTVARSSAAGPSTVATGTYTTSSLPPGTYSVTAQCTGNAGVNSSVSGTLSQVVTSGVTATVLTSSLNPAYQAQTVIFAARVNGVLSTLTGTVNFIDGTQLLGPSPLTAGQATFQTASLGVGAHSITAVYSGDAVNASSTSAVLIETILASDFSLSTPTPSISMPSGHHTTVQIVATAIGNFSDTLTFTAPATLPAWVTLQIAKPTVPLASGGTASASVYLDTDAVLGFFAENRRIPVQRPGTYATLAAIAAGLFAFGKRRRVPALLAVILAMLTLGIVSGCSGQYPPSTAPGDYDMVFTATGNTTGQTHSITVHLHLDPPSGQ